MNSKERQKHYDHFLLRLNFFKKKGLLKLLHRGVSKKFAFKRFNLDIKYNSLEQFAERIFFFGEKSKYFWEQKIGREININDIGDHTFQYIFELLHQIANKDNVNSGTDNFRKRNTKVFMYFADSKNIPDFLSIIKNIEPNQRKKIRNYYFRIIHQLSETKYKKTSLYLSGSTDPNVTHDFSSNEIMINFWDFNFNNIFIQNTMIPVFLGKPYKNQKEISIFSAIFPHHIYSFKYRDQLYVNPALFKSNNFDEMILSGFDIEQANFKERLSTDTLYDKGVKNTWDKYSLID